MPTQTESGRSDGGGGECANHGENGFRVSSIINDEQNVSTEVFQIARNEWTPVRISQSYEGQLYMFKVIIYGNTVKWKMAKIQYSTTSTFEQQVSILLRI